MNFVNEYMNQCIEKGQTTPSQICMTAKEEIASLDIEIKKIESLRLRQADLKSVIKQLGGIEQPKKYKKAPMIVDSLITESELDPYVKEMAIKVCDFIESKHPEKLTPREIMNGVADMESNRVVLTAIKWLWDAKIVQRDEQSLSREIFKGTDWENRPK